MNSGKESRITKTKGVKAMIILNKIQRKDFVCEARETVVFTLNSGRTVYTAKVVRPCHDSRSSLEVKKGDSVILRIPHLETCFSEAVKSAKQIVLLFAKQGI